MIEKSICIYHKSCADGFGAALAVNMFLDKNDGNFEYLPAQYGDVAPCVEGKNVYIVDFSYPRETLIKMHKTAKSIIVLDHHKSAEANLEGLDFCRFDMNKSGAMMAWELFSDGKEVPDLIKYIEDRDLWKWTLDFSREYSAALQLKSMDFEIWKPLLDNASTAKMLDEGKLILAYQQLQVKRALSGNIEMIKMEGYDVPCINTTQLISEIGNELAKGYAFAVMYFDTEDKRVYSLRSANFGIDVSEIASRFGGGGHFHAAGFTTNKPKTQFHSGE